MEEKKLALDKAAYEVFLEKGYKHTNISEIARKAKIAVGSFYKYHQSKEEVFLKVYIKENTRVRDKIIDKINWTGEPEEVIDELFSYTLESVLNNNILVEWSNPAISDVLHNYYYSESAIKDYPFHQFLLSTLKERLNQKKYDTELSDKILKVYDFIYYIDCHITEKDFEGYSETLRTLVKYFVKGVFS